LKMMILKIKEVHKSCKKKMMGPKYGHTSIMF
jgi:hypothetical protein